ncbi:hypothetical protein, partial [Roseiflexus sp.]
MPATERRLLATHGSRTRSIQQFSQRLNQLDRVERSQNRATNTVTEMNFGLRFAGNGRLARHGGHG